MKGEVTGVEPGPEGRYRASVQLAGESDARPVDYWPELLEQWGPDALRAHLVEQAEQARQAEQATAAVAAAAAEHQAQLLGEADALDAPKADEPAEPGVSSGPHG